ncbi:MAG: hypothetical protein LQ344_001939 [Seirophora lacunosa]|nr:MAG: hypothetical protein LQ344_001939 [Seirophora lacunosa]
MLGNHPRGTCIRRVYSYRNERVRVNNPQPLAKTRKSLSEISKRSYPQSCTLLSRLPYEIRLQIWVYTLGQKTFHLRLLPGRLWSRVCKGCREEDGRCHATWHFKLFHDADTSHEERGIASLLRSCQQVYHEAIDVLYSSNTFDISDLGILKYFVQGVPPKRLALIRDLRVHWSMSLLPSSQPAPHKDFGGTWEMFWRIAMVELKGLRTVNIMLCGNDGENNVPHEASHSLNSWREFLNWEFWWDPSAKAQCRLVQGRKKQ